MKFTFKKGQKETGLAGVGHPYPKTKIKHNKLVVGYINPPTWRTKDNKWCVSIAVQKPVTKEEPCSFKWGTVRARFDSEPDARTWVTENLGTVLVKCTLILHHFKKD